MTMKQIQIAGAVIALLIAMGSSYFSLARQVEARPDRTEVRQIIDDKTVDKLNAIGKTVDRLDTQINKVLDKLDTLPRKE